MCSKYVAVKDILYISYGFDVGLELEHIGWKLLYKNRDLKFLVFDTVCLFVLV